MRRRRDAACTQLMRSAIALALLGVAPSLRAQGAQDSAVLEYLGDRASRMAAALPPLPADRQAWEARRREVRKALADALGLPERRPMKAAVEKAVEENGLVIEDVHYLWDERAYVSANVVHLKGVQGRLPALVVPPGWLGSLRDACYKPFVTHMARKGYLVLFIDDPHVGKRQAGFSGLYGLASASGMPVMGVQVFDTLRALDYLLTRADVDPGRIGIAGLCQGSEQTWLAAALEDRFQVVAPVCGTTTYEGWARMPFFLKVALSDPSPYVEGILRRTDWHEIDACIAPRPVLIASNSGDNWWPKAGFDKVVDTLKKVYALYDAPDRFRVVWDRRSHDMTPFIPELEPWFGKHLRPLPPSEAAPLPCEKPADVDFSMIRYFQRRVAQQAERLPKTFASADAWESYRGQILQWLAAACSLGDLKHQPGKVLSSETRDGIVVEVLALPQDSSFACPVAVYSRAGKADAPRPAVVLSLASTACPSDAAAVAAARRLAESGFIVAIPEHASYRRESRRQAPSPGGNFISLYGAGDTVGLPPLVMRVWDDLSCVEYLARREGVDREKILLAGVDEGALDAVAAAVLDRRVAGVTALGAMTVQDWAAQVAPTQHLFDRLLPYLPSIMTRTDWQFLYAAVAPRPLLLVRHGDAKLWPDSAFQRVSDLSRSVYDLAGARKALQTLQAQVCADDLVNRADSEVQKHLVTVGRTLLAPFAPTETKQVPWKPLFTPEEVAAYQPIGPSRRFRHLCYDYNWSGRRLSDLAEKFTQADPVALAEFSQKIHLDAVLLLAVPHHGYCTYNTEVGTRFPGLKEDWFGRCVQELHKRGISAFGYITLGHNWKFMREHYGKPFVHSSLSPDGVMDGQLCLNAPGYLELVEAHTREVLTRYPMDALRYDMLFSPKNCLCDGCKALYRQLHGEELTTWQGKDARRRADFYLATLRRPVERLAALCKRIKPSVEIWQNHINGYSEADLDLGRKLNIAYIEFGDPFRLLFLNGVLDKNGIVVGQTLNSPIRRLIMALGARCYQYMPVNPRTALPDDRRWFENDLAPFFKMVSEVQPYLEGAKTLSHIGVVFSEATRFRYDNYDRKPYMDACARITQAYLARSLPLDFVNRLDLPARDLSRYKLLVLPMTSGLAKEELDVLRRYVQGGGNLRIAGDALRHDERGLPRQDFDLADEMGLRFQKETVLSAGFWRWRNTKIGGGRMALKVAQVGEHMLSLWPRELGSRIDSILLTRDTQFLPSDTTVPAKAGTPGFILIEAEDYSASVPRGGASWKKGDTEKGFSGMGYVSCADGKPFMSGAGYETQAPELQYKVRFPAEGEYQVWVRQHSENGGADSAYVGLDGKGQGAVNFDVPGEQPHTEDGQATELRVAGAWAAETPKNLSLRSLVQTRAVKGEPLLTVAHEGDGVPVLHASPLGKGRIVFLASLDSVELTQRAIDWLAGPMPVITSPAGRQAILTRQENRWILHLLSDGEYSVEIRHDFAPVAKVVSQYPQEGWRSATERIADGLRIRVVGDVKDRLIVLETSLPLLPSPHDAKGKQAQQPPKGAVYTPPSLPGVTE